jgi:DNA-binding NarL/FixJ family response regulator
MKRNSEIKVFLVEDHPVMRLGLKMMLTENGFHVSGEAGNLDEALLLLPKSSADIAIFDLSLNGDIAFSVIEQIRLWLPETGLIIYSMHDATLFVDNAMSLGVNAYVTKADPVETLIDAINSVANSWAHLSHELLKSALSTAAVTAR